MQHSNQSILNRIASYHPIKLPATKIMAAVVVMLLTDKNNELSIVLTKRTETLATYAGHYSFPGGMYDNTDINLWETGKREIQEELNLPAEVYEWIGELDDFHDREGNLVRPFVALMPYDRFQKLQHYSEAEIADIYYLPLHRLSAFQDDPSLHQVTQRRPSYSFRDGSVMVWGLTASILVHLLKVIS